MFLSATEHPVSSDFLPNWLSGSRRGQRYGQTGFRGTIQLHEAFICTQHSRMCLYALHYTLRLCALILAFRFVIRTL